MSKYDFSDFDEPKAKYDFSDFDEQKKPEYDYSNVGQVAKDVVKAATIDGLPVYGQAIGSTVGAVFGPYGAVAGGGIGQAAGDSLRRGLYGFGELITGERPLSDELRLPTKEEALQVLKNTGENAIEGATAEAGGQVAGKAIEGGAKLALSAGKGIKSGAEELAARAMGIDKPRAKDLGIDDIRNVGRFALDEKIITPFANTESMIAKNEALKKKGGEMMGDVYKQIDDAGKSSFNPLETAAKIDEKIGGFYRSPINKGETAQLENTLESVLMRGDKNIPMKEAQALKEELGKVANWKNSVDLKEKEKMAREAYFVVSDAIDESAKKGANEIGVEGLQDVLKKGKEIYSKTKDIDKLLANKAAQGKNNIFGLTDFMAGTAGLGASVLNPSTAPLALGAFITKKYLDKYGAQQSAIILDKLSNGILKNPAAIKLAQESPKAFEKLITSTISSMSVDPIPKKGIEGWVAKGQQRVIESDSSLDSQFLDQVKSNKKFKDQLIRAGELSPNSGRLKEIIDSIKSSDEYKKFQKEKEKQAQGKEPDQAMTRPMQPVKFPLVIEKDGYTAIVRNMNELNEARNEGWS